MTERESSIYDPRYLSLINTLVNCRKSLGITQEQLSHKLGISRQNISKVELCQRRLDIVELQDWLSCLDLKVDLLNHVETMLSS